MGEGTPAEGCSTAEAKSFPRLCLIEEGPRKKRLTMKHDTQSTAFYWFLDQDSAADEDKISAWSRFKHSVFQKHECDEVQHAGSASGSLEAVHQQMQNLQRAEKKDVIYVFFSPGITSSRMDASAATS